MSHLPKLLPLLSLYQDSDRFALPPLAGRLSIIQHFGIFGQG
ncbi:hypothetical protein [Leptolyngbya sp. FACHB-711]|nr:hypothetical protein [Leptolyngbya sp. FACHB-711]